MMRSLIVTGDDFGASPGVNTAIARAYDEGILTGASLLVTGEFASQAVVLARERPHLATGLHLALCDATSASPPAAIPDLVTPDGRFPASPGRTGMVHWIWRRRRSGQLEKEIRAQVERYLETGLPLDHVDGHHHLHMHPVVFDILLRCIEDYKIPWVRLVDEDRRARRRGDPLLGEIVAAIFGLLAAHHRRALTRRGAALRSGSRLRPASHGPSRPPGVASVAAVDSSVDGGDLHPPRRRHRRGSTTARGPVCARAAVRRGGGGLPAGQQPRVRPGLSPEVSS